jgi:hypothetical protein
MAFATVIPAEVERAMRLAQFANTMALQAEADCETGRELTRFFMFHAVFIPDPSGKGGDDLELVAMPWALKVEAEVLANHFGGYIKEVKRPVGVK